MRLKYVLELLLPLRGLWLTCAFHRRGARVLQAAGSLHAGENKVESCLLAAVVRIC